MYLIHLEMGNCLRSFGKDVQNLAMGADQPSLGGVCVCVHVQWNLLIIILNYTLYMHDDEDPI